ncbi:MAG: alpha-D-ribose 1-methylphosphonate 5-triphosphate diphosphatase [Pseudonocardia sp.]|nr:alpha-D-ribose 1-methylphosphonate 5-triphosphate diphosphatase [Pseudonocardia sp.]
MGLDGVTVLPGGGAPPLRGASVRLDADGIVGAIEPGGASDGGFLLPAAVDLHLDVVAARRRPRAGVELDLPGVLAALDAECAGAGIGTICIGARFEHVPAKGVLLSDASALCRTVDELAPYLACDWRVHARVEVTDDGVVEALDEALAATSRVVLVSMMEHSADRTRFASAVENRAFYAADWGIAPEEVDAVMAAKGLGRETAVENRRAVAALARAHGITLAGHDDRTAEQVEQSHALGATVAEFPLTVAAARRARELGMATVLGAPNAVRGRSTAPGNLLVADAVAGGLCDVLCSDYLPGALLAAPFALAGGDTDRLASLVDLVAAHPATALGLCVPRIAVGRPLDAVLVELVGALPMPVATWRRGRLVHRRGRSLSAARAGSGG